MNLGRFIVSKSKKVKKETKADDSIYKGREKVKQDVNKLFNSVAHLFEPFKKAVLSMFPKAKPLIIFLDKVALLIAGLVTLIVYLAFYALSFIKGKLFKFIVLAFIALFLISIVLSRVINTAGYKSYFQDALSDITGYQASVGGTIKVSIVPRPSIFINNVSFHQIKNQSSLQESGSITLDVFETDKIRLDFKFLPLLLGKLVVDTVQIEGANVVLTTSFTKNKLDERALNEQMKDIFQSSVNSNIQNLSSQDSYGLSDEVTPSYSVSLGELTEQSVSSLKQDEQENQNVDNNSSLFKALNKLFIGRIQIKPEHVNGFVFRKVDLSILNQRKTKVFSFQNLSGSLERSITGKISSSGYFFTGKEKHSYGLYSAKVDNHRELDFYVNLADKPSNKISAKGNFVFDGFSLNLDINAGNDAIYYLLSLSGTGPSLFELSSLNLANFNAKLISSSKSIELQNIDFQINHDTKITGGLSLSTGSSSGVAKLDINVSSSNLESLLEGYQAKASKNRSMGQANTSYMFVYLNTLHSSFFKVFDTTHSFANVAISSTNAENPFKLQLSLNRDSKGQYYLNNLNANYKGTELGFAGLLYPEVAQAKLVSFAKGNFQDLLNLFDLEPSTVTALKAISKNSDNFNTYFDVSIQNSKIYFSNVLLKFDNIEFKNLQVNIEERVAITDVAISIKQDSFSYEYFLDILNPSETMSTSSLLAVEKDSFFGMHDKLNVSLKLESEEFTFKNVQLKDLRADIALTSTGIVAQRFEFASKEQGRALLFFSYNKSVNPALAGNITFNNFTLNLEDINDYFFSDYRVKGKVVLNGRLRSSSMASQGFLNTMQGDIRFVKLERFKSNKTNNTKGFFLTLSKSSKEVDGKTELYINDLYGSLQAFSGKFDFFPVVVDYIYGKKKARGSFEGSFNAPSSTLDIRGNISATAKSNVPMAYYFRGDIAKPEYNFVKSDGSLVIKQSAAEQEKKEQEKKVEKTEQVKQIEQQALKEVKGNIKDTNRKTNIKSIGGIGRDTDKLEPSKQLRGANFNNTGEISNPGSSKVDPKSLVPEQLGRQEKKVEKTEEQKKIQKLEETQGIENKKNIKVETPRKNFEDIYPSDRKILDSSKREIEVPSVKETTTTPPTNKQNFKKQEPKPEESGVPEGVDIELWE